MGKISLIFALGILGCFFAGGAVFAQNINTNTSSTSLGSTQFGVVLDPTQMQTVMQSSVPLTCIGSVDARSCGPTVGQGTNSAFIRADQLPGSFTDSPIAGEVSATPNFACGSSALNSNDCQLPMFSLLGAIGETQQTAPDVGNALLPRDLVGSITSRVTLGDDGITTNMPDGFISFTLESATGATTIDQFMSHTIDLGGSPMVFNQRDVTIALGTLIPDPIGSDLTAVLVPFTSLNVGNLGDVGTVVQVPMDMVSRMTLDQGAADGFGGLTLDNQVNWLGALTTAEQFIDLPFTGKYVTPGLNTGIDPFPARPGFEGFAFP